MSLLAPKNLDPQGYPEARPSGSVSPSLMGAAACEVLHQEIVRWMGPSSGLAAPFSSVVPSVACLRLVGARRPLTRGLEF